MKKISVKTLSLLSLSTAAVSLVLRLICMFFFYDKIGYYKVGAILPIISNLLLTVALIFFLVASVFSISKKQSIEPTGKLSQFAALLPMGAALFHLLKIFTSVFNDTNVNKYLMVIGALCTAIFFFFIFYAKKKFKLLTFYLGIGALLYVVLCWVYTYFDFIIPINSTDKIFFYLACAGALIFIFNEMCACYGFVRSRFYYFSLFASVITMAVSSISAIIGYVCGIFKAYITLEADIFFIALLIYAIARLADAQKSKLITEPDVEIKEEAQENVTNDSE
jgi:hypothetical protein